MLQLRNRTTFDQGDDYQVLYDPTDIIIPFCIYRSIDPKNRKGEIRRE
jgi:hypothetical protein